MHDQNITYAYGLWTLVLFNVALFVFFIVSFLHQRERVNGARWEGDAYKQCMERTPRFVPVLKRHISAAHSSEQNVQQYKSMEEVQS